MCNLYSITTNQAAIIALFRVVNRYVGNLAPMPGVFPDYPAPVVRNTDAGREMVLMRWPSASAALRSCKLPLINLTDLAFVEGAQKMMRRERKELERKIAQTRRLAQEPTDPFTRERLAQLIEDLEFQLEAGRLAALPPLGQRAPPAVLTIDEKRDV